eukprot:c3008_g1_i1.p1 GENE.c3008_g1_i1~~c3008_g1_i1.p1  ORF type:complete len:202 (-),score=31.69 c3008_g1_i1:391-996(-)
MRSIFRKFDTLAREHTMVTSCATAGFCCAIGDIVSQKLVEKQEKLDVRRTLTCTTWGLFFAAPFQTRLYRYWDRVWGETTKAKVKKVLLDCFAVPCVVFPAFYLYKGLISNTPTQQIMTDINERLGGTILASNVFWLPASSIAFTIMPPHMRVNFLFSWELVWAGLFSYFCFSEQALAEGKDETETDKTSKKLLPAPISAQ